MKDFMGIMMLIILLTILIWHDYTNTNIEVYLKKKIVFIAVSIEMAIIIFGCSH